ncbi:MAG: GntR family transcriptional regulator [Oscillibacter sp.]|nr:GntR family transcriptional regulator [Oscillibacter sp.]
MYQSQDLGSQPSLKQLVYENLQNKIILGELAPGTKLTEEELAQSMNISRAPIREALNMLERDGFTKIITRKGAVVAEMTRKDAIDIWTCRIALEPFAAREALPNIPPQDIQTALEHIETLEKNAYTFDDYVASDLEVHGLYYNNLVNEYMKSILNNLKAHSVRVRWTKEVKHKNSDQSQISIREHRKILEALQSNDPDAVFNVVKEHIEKSAERLFDALD